MKKCTKCLCVKSIACFTNDKRRPDGKRSMCRNCCKEHRSLVVCKKASTDAKRYAANKTKLLAQRSEYRKNNRDACNAYDLKRDAIQKVATPKWANKFFIREAYSLARLRTKITGIKWQVDHVVPLQSKIVCGLHCETNLSVITATENLRKRNVFNGDVLK
jgi:outer membrane phospholipase A